MTENPLVSIVVPVHNRSAIVGRTLESIAEQTHRPLSLVLVDNGSTDGSLDALRRWADSHRAPDFHIAVVEEPQPGACAARNRGLREVATPYVMFFDSDDTMRPTLLADIHEAIRRDAPDIVGWGATMQMADGHRETRHFPRRRLLWYHLVHSVMATQRYAVLTDLVRSVGAWDTTVRGWNDYELGVRLLSKPRKAVRVGRGPMVDIHFTEQSITGRSFSSDPDKWEHSLSRCEAALRAAGRADALRWIDYRRAILAAAYARECAPAEARRLLASTLSPRPAPSSPFNPVPASPSNPAPSSPSNPAPSSRSSAPQFCCGDSPSSKPSLLPFPRRLLLRASFLLNRLIPFGTFLLPTLFWPRPR